ncbi:hypothetical protein ACEWY4_020298 [Coilia grayii]|uniref:TNFR-Cys domain-containing protein n=1 Tax=Coilia grayii TaxID=363190 RepID=A0ABD1JEG8_9TELE
MGVFWTTLLLCHLLPSLGHSLSCGTAEYQWPQQKPNRCCSKCEPGYRMTSRCPDGSRVTSCTPCHPPEYRDDHNNALTCKMCNRCGEEGQEVLKSCTSSQDTVCTCKPGYKCRDETCSQCDKSADVMMTTIKPQLQGKLLFEPHMKKERHLQEEYMVE